MAGVKLSKKGLLYLENIMTELEIELKDRPDAIRIAFAKGIASDSLPSDEKQEVSKFEFPISVVAKGDEVLLFKHLIIEKYQEKIKDEELDKYILLFVEHGLLTMYNEINKLTNMDNYLFYLLEKHAIK
ncbi:hypothetical protein LIS77_14415 [Cytobacillus firmus]|uniref:hypothetical protein n=1 Tax=Cytobacillus TaxID=2675230 RepID=UPI00207A61A2|nr:hypothetical protein [Cytobacillus firmus]USK37132.1 hypothetical protein LIS77_14415 [Cytobacillus firmus]